MKKEINIRNTDIKAIPFVLGGNVFGWTADEKTSFEILDKYVGEGFQMIDTADVYSHWAPGNKGGESEKIIGNWLKKTNKRKQAIIATKVGAKMSETEHGLKPQYIRQQIEASLNRLQTDYIDIYYTHYDDLNTPIEETLSTYADLVKEGKIRYLATSNMSPERIKESVELSEKHDYPKYIILQPEYNLYKREEYETKYQPLVKELEMSVMPYFSLASGFLTGKYKSIKDIESSNRKDFLTDYINDRGEQILKALHQIAEEYNATPSQIALAWLLANPSITAPIASVSKISQLDILKCVDINLNKEAIDKLNKSSAY